MKPMPRPPTTWKLYARAVTRLHQYCSSVDMGAAEEAGTEKRDCARVPAEAAAAAADEEDEAQKPYASAAEAEAVCSR